MARDSRLLAFRAVALAFWVACIVFLLVPSHKSRDGFKAPGTPQQMPVGARAN